MQHRVAVRFRIACIALVVLLALGAFEPTVPSAYAAGEAAGAPAPEVAPPATPEPEEEVGETPSEEPEPPAPPPLIAEAEALQAQLDEIRERFELLEQERQAADGSDRRVMDHQIAQLKLEYLGNIGRIVENLVAQQRAGLDATPLREAVVAEIVLLESAIVEHIVASEERLAQLRTNTTNAPDAEKLALEQEIGRETAWLAKLYWAYVNQAEHMDLLELDSAGVRDDASARVRRRADTLAGRLEVTQTEIAELRVQVKERGEDPELRAGLAALEVRKKVLTDSLSVVVRMLEALDLDASEYQQLLITATGEVTADIFKARVALGLVEETIERAREWAVERGPGLAFKVLVFLLILVFFRVLSSVVRRVMTRGFRSARRQSSQLLQTMTTSITSNLVLVLGLLVGLSQLGLELGPLLAGLGIAGFIVGFALQDSLANFAAGMMILGYRPYDVGDLIEAAGVRGTVSDMSLVSTTILTIDNQTLIVPNGRIWGDVIVNVTVQQRRRVDMKFRVSYGDDMERTEQVLMDILKSHPKVLAEPEPMVKLHELAESAVEFVARPWTRTEDYWEVYWDVTREVKRRFDAEGITIPVPQRSIVVEERRAAAGADPGGEAGQA